VSLRRYLRVGVAVVVLLAAGAQPAAARVSVTVRVAVAGGAGALAWGLAVAWSESAGVAPALLPPSPEGGDSESDRGWTVVLPLLVIPLR